MNFPYTSHADSYASYANELMLKDKRIQDLEASLRECVESIDNASSYANFCVPDCVEKALQLLNGAPSATE